MRRRSGERQSSRTKEKASRDWRRLPEGGKDRKQKTKKKQRRKCRPKNQLDIPWEDEDTRVGMCLAAVREQESTQPKMGIIKLTKFIRNFEAKNGEPGPMTRPENRRKLIILLEGLQEEHKPPMDQWKAKREKYTRLRSHLNSDGLVNEDKSGGSIGDAEAEEENQEEGAYQEEDEDEEPNEEVFAEHQEAEEGPGAGEQHNTPQVDGIEGPLWTDEMETIAL